VTILKCDIPSVSVLDRGLIEAAYFQDSYRAPLRHVEMSVVAVFHAIFAHHPLWMKLLLIVRNRIASWCGLAAPSAAAILHPQVNGECAVGDTIGVWPVYSLTDNELVAGRDNKHLDFRLSVLKSPSSVTVSTICIVHNRFGKVYLFFIVPFHRWGVQRLIADAVKAGRL